MCCSLEKGIFKSLAIGGYNTNEFSARLRESINTDKFNTLNSRDPTLIKYQLKH